MYSCWGPIHGLIALSKILNQTCEIKKKPVIGGDLINYNTKFVLKNKYIGGSMRCPRNLEGENWVSLSLYFFLTHELMFRGSGHFDSHVPDLVQSFSVIYANYCCMFTHQNLHLHKVTHMNNIITWWA